MYLLKTNLTQVQPEILLAQLGNWRLSLKGGDSYIQVKPLFAGLVHFQIYPFLHYFKT